jgi:hypothetical protein
VSQNDAVVSIPVHIGIDAAMVLCWKGEVLLRLKSGSVREDAKVQHG